MNQPYSPPTPQPEYQAPVSQPHQLPQHQQPQFQPPYQQGNYQQPPHQQPPSVMVVNNMEPQFYGPAFRFDGGAGTYVGTAILAILLVIFTFGLGTPWAICIQYRWKTEHTIINGRRLHFTGTGAGLFGNWIKWWFLCIITLGIYIFWVVPRLTKWTVERQEFGAMV